MTRVDNVGGLVEIVIAGYSIMLEAPDARWLGEAIVRVANRAAREGG